MQNTNYISQGLVVGKHRLVWGERTYIMGVINVSPESFSGDGLTEVEAAIEQGRRFIEEGADILDVGGQSTRPVYGAGIEAGLTAGDSGLASSELSVEEEARRVVPVIQGLAAELDVPISVDTYKPEVARQALRVGASIVNDVWGLKSDTSLAEVAAKHGAPIVLMHNQHGTDYGDLMEEVRTSLERSIEQALVAGVPAGNIVVDPGYGFGKLPADNFEVLRRLGEIKAMGYPVLVGTSRKSSIGLVLGLPVDERVEGTAATVAIAIANGADIVRVHDVKAMARVAHMSDAIVRGWRPKAEG